MTRRGRGRGFLARVLAVAGGLALATCDSGPSGPGVIGAEVVSPQPLGAVVLEFTGPGIRGFEGQGTTRVYSAQTSATAATHRVILVSPDGGELRFGIRVDDVRAPSPTVAAVAAALPTNVPILATGLQVKLER